MNNNILKKLKALAVLGIFTLIAMSSLCFSQSVDLRYDIRDLRIETEFGYKILDIQSDTVKGTPDEKIIKSNTDPANKFDQIVSIDSTKYNMFGDLLNDDPVYNRKYPVWIPLSEVLGLHAILGFNNRYVANADFGRVGFNSWKHNIKTGWEWDTDRFGMNFLGHPYSGGLNFMSARSNGYNFWASIPFAIGGSFMWEYFGENTLPAYNDIINTPISGIFYGEILYRLSSNVLDDRTTGMERFIREFGAALISPTRFVNRLIQGKLTQFTTEEVYQKSPLNIELSMGMRKLNEGRSFWTGTQNTMFNLQLDYGYPFENRYRKPFDCFQVRTEVNLGVGRKLLSSLTGYGILYGKNVKYGDMEMLFGIFQHYNYFDNKTFELGAIAFGGGIMTRYPIHKDSYLFTNLHLGIVPLAGNSKASGPNTSEFGDYNYGGGTELKIESGLNLYWASIQLVGYYFWIHTYSGNAGDNYIGLIKPRISVKLYQDLSIGFEQLVYYSDRYTRNFGNYHVVRSEQKIYLTYNLGNFKL